MAETASGNHAILDITPVIDTLLYTSGDNVGGVITLSDAVLLAGGGGIIRSVALMDTAEQSAAMDVAFFDADPSASTFTDQAAAALADADLVKLIGIVQLTTYITIAGGAFALASGLDIPFRIPSARDLFAALVVRAGPTYGAIDALALRVAIERV